jgi:hypothetical protein
MRLKVESPLDIEISLQKPSEWKGILDYSRRKDLLGWDIGITPLSYGFLHKFTRRIIRSIKRDRTPFLTKSKETMVS